MGWIDHVKLTDTADAVTRRLSEKQAGENDDGAVDMIWINGANFAGMNDVDLLFGPYAGQLPDRALGRVVFVHDTAGLVVPLGSMQAILEWCTANSGRFTYPQPPDFRGMTFRKQAQFDLPDDPLPFSRLDAA